MFAILLQIIGILIMCGLWLFLFNYLEFEFSDSMCAMSGVIGLIIGILGFVLGVGIFTSIVITIGSIILLILTYLSRRD